VAKPSDPPPAARSDPQPPAPPHRKKKSRGLFAKLKKAFASVGRRIGHFVTGIFSTGRRTVAAAAAGVVIVFGVIFGTAARGPEAPPPPPSAGASAGTYVPISVPGAITAVFDQGAFLTTYSVSWTNPGANTVRIQWAGPNCGASTPSQAQTSTAAGGTAVMTWQHPHPPCAASTDHSDVLVTATISDGRTTLVCSYQGAASGTGSCVYK
jgi:hypothetical protein